METHVRCSKKQWRIIMNRLAYLIHGTLYPQLLAIPRGSNKNINFDNYLFCMFLHDYGEFYNPLGR